jgi:hypothetical protein
MATLTSTSAVMLPLEISRKRELISFTPLLKQPNLIFFGHSFQSLRSRDYTCTRSTYAPHFLNGHLKEYVYVELPSTIAPRGTYWKLENFMFGLRQAARAWHTKMCKELISKEFRQSHTDPCVFYRGYDRDLVYLLVHGDDGLIVGVREQVLAARDAIKELFDITDAG